MTVELFAWTDGACSGNPGPGGWGVLMRALDGGATLKERELSGGEPDTTNNRMELMAAISALEALTQPSRIVVVTDSVYVKNGLTQWIHGWKRKGWRTADNKPVKNVELWQRLEAAASRHTVEWRWIKGHAGHAENERADALARAGMAPFKPVPAAPGQPADAAAQTRPKAPPAGRRQALADPRGAPRRKA